MKNRSATAEQWINTWTDQFEFKTVDIADIDRVKSQHVQNRSAVKLDDENVLEMMIWIDDSDHVLPPIIVNKVGAKYYIIDGNHRAEAHVQAGRVTIDAYVVEVDQDKYEGMVMAANARMGRSLTPHERVELAISMSKRYGTRVAAEQLLMRPDDLQREIRIQQGRHMVEEALGVKATHWPKKKLEALQRLDVEHIKKMDKKTLEDSTAAAVESAVKNILYVPPSQQLDEAQNQEKSLAQNLKRGRTPKAKPRGITTAYMAKQKCREIEAFIRANPAALNDRDLVEALNALFSEMRRINGAEVNAA